MILFEDNKSNKLGSTNQFWQFSLQVYERKDFAHSCISLQDNYGIDVNILLYCCWAASEGHSVLLKEEIDSLCRSVKNWNHEVVQKLRSIRRYLKNHDMNHLEAFSQNIRCKVLEIEIKAEQVEQDLLTNTVSISKNKYMSDQCRVRNALENIRTYFAILGVPKAASTSELRIILKGVFPNIIEKDIDAA